MRRSVIVLLVAVVAAIAAAGYFVVDAQRGRKAKRPGSVSTTVASFRLKDLDGKEVTAEDDRIANKRVAYVFVSPYSAISEQQAAQVIAQRAKIGGALVVVATGAEGDVRALRARLGGDALWLAAQSSEVTKAFRSVFEDVNNFDRVPALVVTDASRKVQHSSVGELSDEDIGAALAASGE